MSEQPVVQVGGGYVENPDHIPNPTDIDQQYNTSGVGAHQVLENVSPIFMADRKAVANQALRALDPEDLSVPSSRVILPGDPDPKEALEKFKAASAKMLEEPVTVGGPTPSMREAEKSEGEGEQAAAQETATNWETAGGVGVGLHTGASPAQNTPATGSLPVAEGAEPQQSGEQEAPSGEEAAPSPEAALKAPKTRAGNR